MTLPPDSVFGDWDGSVVQARRLQHALARQVVLDDAVPAEPAWLAGFDVGFEDEG
ncbi:endonuclease V, partial [Xanthomonas sp. Kuri4-3]